MTRDAEFFAFDDEIERIEEKLQSIASDLADLDEDNAYTTQLLERGRRLDAELGGLRWAREEWDADGVTLAGLTGGEFGEVEDTLSEGVANGRTAGDGASRVLLVARGTVVHPEETDGDTPAVAPYMNERMSDNERVAAAEGLPPNLLKWAAGRVNDKTIVSGNGGKRFSDWLAEAQQSTTPTSTEG